MIGGDACRRGEDVEQVDDLRHDVAVLAEDLVLLQTGQPLQPQLEDRLRLRFGEPVSGTGVRVLRLPAELDRESLGPRGLGGRAGEHFLDQRRAPAPAHQPRLRVGRRRRRLDQRDDLVDVGQRDGEPLQDVAPLARLAQLEARAAHDDLAPVLQEMLEEALEVEQARLVVDQRHHVHAEAVLQLGQLVELVDDDLGNLAALQLDHHAHARLVRLVAQVGDAVELLVADQLADAHQQVGLVHLVRNLVDDDRLALALADVLDVGARADDHAAAAGAVALAHALQPVDDPGGRKIGRRHDLDQLVDRQRGVREQREAGVDDLGQVVGRDVGRHPDGDAGRAVDEQIGQPRRQHRRLLLLAVVVGREIDGFPVDVRGELVGDLLQPALGVAHRGGVVAVDRAEIALPVDQRVAQREVLRHSHQRVVDRHVAVRVVLAHHLADDAGALDVRAVPDGVRLVHRVQHPPVHRLQAVADVRQRPPHDHAHCIIEVRMAHFRFQAYRKGFFRKLLHGRDRQGEMLVWGAGRARAFIYGVRQAQTVSAGPASFGHPPRRRQRVSRRPETDVRRCRSALKTRNFITPL